MSSLEGTLIVGFVVVFWKLFEISSTLEKILKAF
jgi:hypothetical protein